MACGGLLEETLVPAIMRPQACETGNASVLDPLQAALS